MKSNELKEEIEEIVNELFYRGKQYGEELGYTKDDVLYEIKTDSEYSATKSIYNLIQQEKAELMKKVRQFASGKRISKLRELEFYHDGSGESALREKLQIDASISAYGNMEKEIEKEVIRVAGGYGISKSHSTLIYKLVEIIYKERQAATIEAFEWLYNEVNGSEADVKDIITNKLLDLANPTEKEE